MTFLDALGVKYIVAICTLLLLTACGGGGGGGSGGGTGTTAPTVPAMPITLSNFTTLTVDDGPAALGTGNDASRAVDEAFVSVTICAPGTATCQTIDHVLVDTGSVGLRIPGSVIGSALLAALPEQTDAQSNPVGECYGYVDGYVFGSVRQTDFKIGGEAVANMPIQVIGDSGAFAIVPPECSSGGGDNISTVKGLAANGIIGIGVTGTDCGQYCTVSGGHAAAIYYDCPAKGCGAIIARAASMSAPFQQLPNPVAAMAVDNNGSILDLPSLPSNGSRTAAGMLYFGIGTQTNNTLGTATTLTTTSSADRNGVGLVSVAYQGRTLPDSFLDSGSNAYYFSDSTIPKCTAASETGYYCPKPSAMPAPVITGANGTRYSAGFSLFNADTLFSSGNAALPGLGADPADVANFQDISNSFDFGLPLFFGHRVYTAIEGRPAGTGITPFFAIL